MIRLIHCGEWKLKEFDPYELPKYAILSHRWFNDTVGNPQEVTYQNLLVRLNGSKRGHARSWAKIEKARDIAWGLNIKWIWIDNCCINKRDASELSEAISSMYQWYAQSQVCIAYLDDMDRIELGPSSWFFRGWTLQELVAPSQVLFYNKTWEYCGSRNGYRIEDAYDMATDLSSTISSISGIERHLLRLNDSNQIRRYLPSIPACQKMSWASKRKTTKKEDMAYCLIGIFGINNMYPRYGEGGKAFIRLQEEIVKQTSDLTLFAWVVNDLNECDPDNLLTYDDINGDNDIEHSDHIFKFHQALHGIFACHPREFASANNIKPMQHIMYNDEITITSKGVKFTTALWGTGPDSLFAMPLYCYDQTPSQPLAIHMRWVGGEIYARTNVTKTIYLPTKQAPLPSQDDIIITHKIYYLNDCLHALHRNCIHIPKIIYSKIGSETVKQLERTKVSPGFLWCEERNLLMTYGSRYPLACATYQVTQNHNRVVVLVFGLDHMEEPWLCLVEPSSQLAPSRLETRRAYLDRIWRSASQERFENIHFVANATWGLVTQACEFRIQGRFGNSGDRLDGQPIFSVSLEAHVIPISPSARNIENAISTPSAGENLAPNLTTRIGEIGNAGQSKHLTICPLPAFPATSELEKEKTRIRLEQIIPVKTPRSLRSIVGQYISKKTGKSTEQTEAQPMVTQPPSQISGHCSPITNSAPSGTSPVRRYARPPPPDKAQYRQSHGLSVVIGTEIISTQSIHTSNVVGYNGVRHTPERFTTTNIVDGSEDSAF